MNPSITNVKAWRVPAVEPVKRVCGEGAPVTPQHVLCVVTLRTGRMKDVMGSFSHWEADKILLEPCFL